MRKIMVPSSVAFSNSDAEWKPEAVFDRRKLLTPEPQPDMEVAKYRKNSPGENRLLSGTNNKRDSILSINPSGKVISKSVQIDPDVSDGLHLSWLQSAQDLHERLGDLIHSSYHLLRHTKCVSCGKVPEVMDSLDGVPFPKQVYPAVLETCSPVSQYSDGGKTAFGVSSTDLCNKHVSSREHNVRYLKPSDTESRYRAQTRHSKEQAIKNKMQIYCNDSKTASKYDPNKNASNSGGTASTSSEPLLAVKKISNDCSNRLLTKNKAGETKRNYRKVNITPNFIKKNILAVKTPVNRVLVNQPTNSKCLNRDLERTFKRN